MFIKPFKTKSNTQIKSTERKKIRNRIERSFKVTEDEWNLLFSPKVAMSQVKIIANNGRTVTVYTSDKRPIFFEVSDDENQLNNVILPTVYALWQLPELVPVFTTHAAVLPRLAGGADLMLPGVIRQGDGRSAYGNYARNTVVAVNLTSNRSVVGVGLLARSSDDLFEARNSGICVKMLHVFGDKLWNLEPSHVLQIPNAGATVKVPKLDDFPELGEAMSKPKKSSPKEPEATIVDVNQDEDLAQLETNLNNVELSNENESSESSTGADGLSPDEKLKCAFLTAIKKMGKNPPTPLLTSNFYRCHILTVDDSIDIKHTSYKKLSKFLHEMAANGYLTVKEETKGVEKITAFNTQHPDILNLILRVEAHQQQSAEGGEATADSLFVTEMKELYIVGEATMKFFNTFDVKCGEGIEPAQVKKYVKDYVCNKKLQDQANIRTIHVDDMIRETCELNADVTVIPFDQLLALITDKMEHSYAMRNKNELKTSGKTVPIKMTLATRSGNKKVTLIDHLEMFGIRLPEFAQACKIGVAASTSIIRPDCPGNSNKGQLLVQGNQIRFVYKLLTETYKIPPKYINGLDLAKKDKKPKKK